MCHLDIGLSLFSAISFILFATTSVQVHAALDALALPDASARLRWQRDQCTLLSLLFHDACVRDRPLLVWNEILNQPSPAVREGESCSPIELEELIVFAIQLLLNAFDGRRCASDAACALVAALCSGSSVWSPASDRLSAVLSRLAVSVPQQFQITATDMYAVARIGASVLSAAPHCFASDISVFDALVVQLEQIACSKVPTENLCHVSAFAFAALSVAMSALFASNEHDASLLSHCRARVWSALIACLSAAGVTIRRLAILHFARVQVRSTVGGVAVLWWSGRPCLEPSSSHFSGRQRTDVWTELCKLEREMLDICAAGPGLGIPLILSQSERGAQVESFSSAIVSQVDVAALMSGAVLVR